VRPSSRNFLVSRCAAAPDKNSAWFVALLFQGYCQLCHLFAHGKQRLFARHEYMRGVGADARSVHEATVRQRGARGKELGGHGWRTI